VRFLAPWWLLLLLPVAALAALYVVQHRRRSKYAVRFATVPMLQRLIARSPGWRRHAPASVQLLALGLLGLAAARPEMALRVPQEQATVMVVVDTSLSMGQRDVSPSRIAAAVEAAGTFIDGLPDEYDVGVVGFARAATVLTPPTTDHAQAAASLEGLTLGGGTAIGEGIFTSLRQVETFAARIESDAPARIVLLSDGQNTVGRPPGDAALAADEAGVPVTTIAYGSDASQPSASDQGSGPTADRGSLREIAETSGGSAYVAEDGEELSEVYDEIQSSIGWRTEDRDVTAYAAALAFLLALGAAAMSLRWFSRLP
jgi:Ca-activated chloride channel family protein